MDDRGAFPEGDDLSGRITRFYKHWTSEEEDVLRNSYDKLSKQELMVRLPNHTWMAIQERAWKLGKRHYGMGWAIREFSREEAIWLACAFDSEGSVTMTVNYTKRGHPMICSDFRITNNNLDYLEKVRQIIGYGIIASCSIKTGHYFALSGMVTISKVLKQIYPYLIVKKEKSDLILEATKYIVLNNNHRRPADSVLFEIQRKFAWQSGHGARVVPFRLDLAKWDLVT
jgi:hypothetical protein